MAPPFLRVVEVAAVVAVVAVPGIDVLCQVMFMGNIAAAIARAPARFNTINRAMSHGSDRQAAPACSKTVYMVSPRIDGRRQRHGNVMTSVRIVDRFQDTTGVQEPCHGEIFCWRGEMHAKFASIRSPTAGKQRSGTALLR